MTKTELKGMRVSEKREVLEDLYEDPEGDFERMTSDQLNDFIDANWDEMESLLDDEESDEPVEEDKEAEAEGSGAKNLSRPNPATDLYSGRIRA